MPIPLADPRNPAASLSNLLDPLTGTLTSSDFRHVSMRTLNGTSSGTAVNEDLGDGVHPRINTFGANFDYRIAGDWRLSERIALLVRDSQIQRAVLTDSAAERGRISY